MDNTQIIPVGKRIDHVYVDEPGEFQAFASRTDVRKRIVRNCTLRCLGMVATCCGICAALACRATYPALATFPAALALLAIWAGVRVR